MDYAGQPWSLSGRGIGFQSERFIRFYFCFHGFDAARHTTSRRSSAGWTTITSRAGNTSPTCSISASLHPALHRELPDPAGAGLRAAHVEFVESLKHVVPVGGAEIGFTEQATSHDWASFYTPDLREIVRQKDRLLFGLPGLRRSGRA